jgi:hypothetical protein
MSLIRTFVDRTAFDYRIAPSRYAAVFGQRCLDKCWEQTLVQEIARDRERYGTGEKSETSDVREHLLQ